MPQVWSSEAYRYFEAIRTFRCGKITEKLLSRQDEEISILFSHALQKA